MGRSGDATTVADFTGGSTASCFVDGSDVYTAYDAAKDDVVIIDRQGQIRHRFDSGEHSLREAAQRDKVDGWVRELLE